MERKYELVYSNRVGLYRDPFLRSQPIGIGPGEFDSVFGSRGPNHAGVRVGHQ